MPFFCFHEKVEPSTHVSIVRGAIVLFCTENFSQFKHKGEEISDAKPRAL